LVAVASNRRPPPGPGASNRIRKTGRHDHEEEGAAMPRAIRLYVRFVDAVNRVVGRFAMYMIFAMMGLLLFSSIMKTFFLPVIWTLELAQFSMAAYYLLGGGYSMQLGSHVRMDLAYGRWSSKGKGFADSMTSFCLVFYLVVLLYGGYSSTGYALQYGETSYSSWSPLMAPIKIIMTFGVALMLLQAIATFFKDLARVRGLTLEEETPA
jgi:TRAP-type mannitol/chloroaromatic compound transport system permease small subunit